MPTPGWMADAQGICVQANDAAAAIGITPGENWLARFDTDDDQPAASLDADRFQRSLTGVADPQTGRELRLRVDGTFDRQTGVWTFTACDVSQEHRWLDRFNRVHGHQMMLGHVLSHLDNGAAITDPKGRIKWVNTGYEKLTGECLGELIGRPAGWLVQSTGKLDPAVDRMQVAVDTGHGVRETILRRRQDGSEYWVSIDAMPVFDEHGQVDSYVSIQTDVTELIQTQERLEQSEHRYALAAEGTSDALFDWDLQNDHVYFSPRWWEMLGYSPTESFASSEDWFSLVQSADLMQLQADVSMHMAEQTDRLVNEHRLLHADGTWRWMLCRGRVQRDADGTAIRLAGSISDVSKSKEAERSLRLVAEHDALTGLHNRWSLIQRLDAHLQGQREGRLKPCAVLFLDFDRFKLINDGLGHAAGDKLLKSIAARLNRELRGGDFAARLGGDEFVIMLSSVESIDYATRVGDRLLAALAEPHELEGQPVTITASVGIVVTDRGDYASADALLRDADTAMYEAKARGKATHVLFDSHMHEQAYRRLTLEHELRDAWDRGELELNYQPLVHLETGATTGFETLMRWTHPEMGPISPAEFIPVAEETGLIVPMGRWALQESCRWITALNRSRAGDPLSIHVNLSKRQLMQGDVAETVAEALRVTGMAPEQLDLEITESTVAGSDGSLTDVLHALRELGCKMSMDDFGTGESSLSCLHEFPITTLKVDRSFVRNMDVRTEFVAVVQAILTLARTMGISVVAEGIETQEQLARLQALDCDYGQGYFFAKPMPAHEAETFVAAHGDRFAAQAA